MKFRSRVLVLLVLLCAVSVGAAAFTYCPESGFQKAIDSDPVLQSSGRLIDWGSSDCGGPGGSCVLIQDPNGVIVNCVKRGR
jgi:hypothetical protein